MEVTRARILKEELESKIKDLVREYEKATGAYLTEINLTKLVTTFTGIQSDVAISVEVKVEI